MSSRNVCAGRAALRGTLRLEGGLNGRFGRRPIPFPARLRPAPSACRPMWAREHGTSSSSPPRPGRHPESRPRLRIAFRDS